MKEDITSPETPVAKARARTWHRRVDWPVFGVGLALVVSGGFLPASVAAAVVALGSMVAGVALPQRRRRR